MMTQKVVTIGAVLGTLALGALMMGPISAVAGVDDSRLVTFKVDWTNPLHWLGMDDIPV
jgi:hypothetical protein